MTDNIEHTSQWLLNQYPNLFNSVIQINAIKDNNLIGTGTGFLIHKDESILLCTNKHVIAASENVLEGNSSIIFADEARVHIYLRNGKSSTLTIPVLDNNKNLSNKIKIHPRNFIDVALIDVSSDMHILRDYIDISYTPIDFLFSENNNSGFIIKEGEKAYVLGYPHGKSLNELNYPYASESNLSRINEFPFNKMNSLSIIEATIIGNNFIYLTSELYRGMSGAPVIILPTNQNELLTNPLIIGICSIFDQNNTNAHAYKASTILEILPNYQKTN